MPDSNTKANFAIVGTYYAYQDAEFGSFSASANATFKLTIMAIRRTTLNGDMCVGFTTEASFTTVAV